MALKSQYYTALESVSITA